MRYLINSLFLISACFSIPSAIATVIFLTSKDTILANGIINLVFTITYLIYVYYKSYFKTYIILIIQITQLVPFATVFAMNLVSYPKLWCESCVIHLAMIIINGIQFLLNFFVAICLIVLTTRNKLDYYFGVRELAEPKEARPPSFESVISEIYPQCANPPPQYYHLELPSYNKFMRQV